MLKSYEISNFRSYKNRTKIELEKTNYQTLVTTNVSDRLLKGLMFVGGNATGKSNAIIAIKFLLDCLLGKTDINMESYICIFSGNPVMELNYEFEIDGVDINYYISYQRIDKIINEELKVDGKTVFSRNGSVAIVSISTESSYTDVPRNTLFLRDIYFNTKFRGSVILQKWFNSLENSVYIDLYEKRITQYKDLDLTLKNYIENIGTDEINQFFNEHNFEQSIEYDNKVFGHTITAESAEKMIFFKRKGIDEPIPFMLESLGNINLLNLLPSFFHCVKNDGMLILDEFSSGFHNELEELLLKYFMHNASKGQILFVSHSTNLLSNSILRPDQIYAVDFSGEGSVIKRFSSEKPREAQNLEKMYLGGVFSGIPKYESNFK